jgi:hypothetical protein
MQSKKRRISVVSKTKQKKNAYSSGKINLRTTKARGVAQLMTPLINSIAAGVEEKLILEDSIVGMANEAEALNSYLDYMPSAQNRRKLLLAYKKFLKAMIIDVDNMLSSKKYK